MFVSHLYIYINLSIIIFSGQLSYRKLLPVHPALSNKNVNLLSNKKKRQFSLMLCLIKVHMVLGSLGFKLAHLFRVYTTTKYMVSEKCLQYSIYGHGNVFGLTWYLIYAKSVWFESKELAKL